MADHNRPRLRPNSQKANEHPSSVENERLGNKFSLISNPLSSLYPAARSATHTQLQTSPTNSQTKLSSTSTAVSATRNGPSLRRTSVSNSRSLSILSDEHSTINTTSVQAVSFEDSGPPIVSASSGRPGMRPWLTHGSAFDYGADLSVPGLTADLHDELTGYFWEYYNTVLPVVDRDTLPNGKDSRNSTSCKRLLYLCILKIGFRYVNREDPRVRALVPPDRESTLHLRAKQLVEGQFEKLNGLSAVQTLILLGDLELGVGRYKPGWIYSGEQHILK
jgi:hypothetical protein